MHFLKFCPKRGELADVCNRYSILKGKSGDPKIILKAIAHRKFFFLEILKIEWAISLGFKPSSQGECQNMAVCPLSIVRLMEA
jgi:hypothetical protein